MYMFFSDYRFMSEDDLKNGRLIISRASSQAKVIMEQEGQGGTASDTDNGWNALKSLAPSLTKNETPPDTNGRD